MNATSPLIRTFRARDARAALTAVKAAFGIDAVIIGTKQVPGGFFGRPSIEVTAAAGAEAPRPDKSVETDVAALRRVMEDVRRTLHRRPGTPTNDGERGQDGEARGDAPRIVVEARAPAEQEAGGVPGERRGCRGHRCPPGLRPRPCGLVLRVHVSPG